MCSRISYLKIKNSETIQQPPTTWTPQDLPIRGAPQNLVSCYLGTLKIPPLYKETQVKGYINFSHHFHSQLTLSSPSNCGTSRTPPRNEHGQNTTNSTTPPTPKGPSLHANPPTMSKETLVISHEAANKTLNRFQKTIINMERHRRFEKIYTNRSRLSHKSSSAISEPGFDNLNSWHTTLSEYGSKINV